jgi:hypothetical protein
MAALNGGHRRPIVTPPVFLRIACRSIGCCGFDWVKVGRRFTLTRKQLQRGVHTSTSQLEADIRAFIERHNENPKPCKWTKSAEEILASVKRFCHKTKQALCSEL